MILEISVIIIAAFIVILVIGLLIALAQIRRTAKEAEKLFDTVRQQIAPISHDLTIIVNNSKNIFQSIERQILKVELGVDAIKDTAENIKRFEEDIQERIANPLLEVSIFITTISRALNKIFGYFSK